MSAVPRDADGWRVSRALRAGGGRSSCVQLAGGESRSSPTRARRARDAAAGTDPALVRLLPDAYPDDPAASAEFRRFTADGLAERKSANARIVIESLAQRDGDDPWRSASTRRRPTAWLRAITDIRLVLGARLGIVQDGDEGDIHDEESALQRAVYDWLAGVQEFLVLAALQPRR